MQLNRIIQPAGCGFMPGSNIARLADCQLPLAGTSLANPVTDPIARRGTYLKIFMRRILWIMILMFSLQTVGTASGIGVFEKAGGGGVDENSLTTIALDSASTPKVIDWKEEVSLPDDVLFVRHQTGSLEFALIYLVSLDSAGKIAALRPISGFSLYLNRLTEQISKIVFSPKLAGETFVLRIPDPLQKASWDLNLYRTGACTSATDLRKLYQLGALFWRDKDNDAASHCYKYILARNPASVAARYGLAEICRSRKDPCASEYLRSLIASNPEFIEAREALIALTSGPANPAQYASDLSELLKLDLPLAKRLFLIDKQEFWLERMDKIDDALRVIKKWNAAASELLSIYPPAMSTYYIEAMHNGLLAEAKGFDEDAIGSYHIASSVAGFYRLVPDSARYEIDLGLARTLRKTGHAEEALDLCNAWKKRWKKLVSRPVHHPWELREDGPGELGGRWEFSCGSPEKGFELIQGAIKQYPDSNAPYTALSQYYYSIGEIEKARAAEATASRLLDEWGKRLGEF